MSKSLDGAYTRTFALNIREGAHFVWRDKEFVKLADGIKHYWKMQPDGYWWFVALKGTWVKEKLTKKRTFIAHNAKVSALVPDLKFETE